MSFFSKLWEVTKQTTSFVGDKLKQVGVWIKESFKTIKTLDPPPPPPPPNPNPTLPGNPIPGSTNWSQQSINDDIIKEAIDLENKLIERYQKEVARRAKSREKAVKIAYLNIYEQCLDDFKLVLDKDVIDEIEDYTAKKSKVFSNTMRDEVNEKVNSSYIPWIKLTKNHPTERELRKYCNQVYFNADSNLLDLLQSSIKDTNSFIRKCVNKYNEDKAKALIEMKESLKKLTAEDENYKFEELSKIAEENAITEFITIVTQQNLDNL